MLDPRQKSEERIDELTEKWLDAPEWEVWEEEDRDAGVEKQPSRRVDDQASGAKLVVRAVGDIDGCSCDDRFALLSDLLCAAWPSEHSQHQ